MTLQVFPHHNVHGIALKDHEPGHATAIVWGGRWIRLYSITTGAGALKHTTAPRVSIPRIVPASPTLDAGDWVLNLRPDESATSGMCTVNVVAVTAHNALLRLFRNVNRYKAAFFMVGPCCLDLMFRQLLLIVARLFSGKASLRVAVPILFQMPSTLNGLYPPRDAFFTLLTFAG
jgi:hypothetical protein